MVKNRIPFTIWCGALSTEQRSLGEANWRSFRDTPRRVRAPAPFARNAPGQTSHGKSGANIPGENGDLNHGVVIDLILHWPSWYAGPQAPPRQRDLIGRLDITLRGIAAICAILRRSEHAKKFTRVDAVLHSATGRCCPSFRMRPTAITARVSSSLKLRSSPEEHYGGLRSKHEITRTRLRAVSAWRPAVAK